MTRSYLILLLVAFASCASKQDLFLSAYRNRGPVPLNPSNPYIGPNRLVSSEMERNSVMDGFIRQAGMPEAIDVRKRPFGSYKICLYYAQRGEAYLAEQRSGDWLITGPEKIPDEVLGYLKGLTEHIAAAADTPAAPEKSQVEAAPGAPKTISARRIEEAVGKGSKENDTEDAAEPSTRPGGGSATESFPSSAKYSADLEHHVAFEGETLRLIAEWYTGSRGNAELIASYNRRADPNRITIGDSIRIPSYMLTRRTPLPLQEVDRYQSSLSSGARSASWEKQGAADR